MHAEYAKPASEYAGASGAVVLKLPDNEMLGLLWGCSKYPTFTPIRTVFADISRVTQAQEVELHRDSEAATPRMPSISASANEALLISGSELDALELRPYKSEDMVPPSMTSELKAKISKRLTALLRATPSKYPQSNTTTDIVDESRTTTPSLSSSRASSPGVLPSTPNEQSNEVLAISESTQQLVLVVGEDIETVSGSNVEDGDTFEGSPFNQLLRNDSAIPRAFSIPPIIGDGRQMPKEHLFSPQPSRRWNTWPFRSEDWSVSMERHNQLEVIIQ
ncbi:hypothetical protein B0O99DRAFT_638310 [Bisporella sp. PMI_857]|nr:hypothetical protein B0O99DRAFT_638310 [Bisporella sp. PMI_857]